MKVERAHGLNDEPRLQGDRSDLMRPHSWLARAALAIVLIWIVTASVWTANSIWVRKDRILRRFLPATQTASPEQAIKDYLASTNVPKLQIGAGPNSLQGWLNTDIEPRPRQVFLDAMKPFPIPDNSLKYVYAEQIIEHLPFDGAMVMLQESYRTLMPGGTLRLATPDVHRLLSLFDQESTDAERRFMTQQLERERVSVKDAYQPLFALNMYFRNWGHQFLWDRQTLQSVLQSAGFQDVRFVRHHESDEPELRSVERHIDVIGRDIDEYVTMIVQARK
jgi:predicted SAM-dependent methyltransferase